MNDPVVVKSLHPACNDVPSDASLDALPAAAAVLDARLRLVKANARLLSLLPAARAGTPLPEVLPPAGAGAVAAPEHGDFAYLARGACGRSFEVTLARTGASVGALVRPAQDEGAGRPAHVAAEKRVQDALLTLSREVALAAAEDELVAAIARCIRQLFPRAHFCVRIVDPRTLALTSLYAEGRMLDGERDRLALRRGAADKAHLEWRSVAAERLTLVDSEPLVFEGSAGGFATPLVAAGQFFGIVNLEYPAGVAADCARDERLLIQLANQAAIGVRNAKLIEELTFLRRYNEDLLENANALIFVVNRERQVILFNNALEQLTGLERAEVIGRDLLELVPEADVPGLRRILEKSLRGERVTAVETLLLNNERGEVRITLSTGAVFTPDGQVEGVIAIGQDITRQKELERRIVQAEKLASLGQLAAGVVHEINNPLTTITMYAEALLQLAPVRRTDPADVEKLRRIHESSERILKFARDLTSYAKPAPDRPQMLDVHALLDQAARYCEHALKQSRATLERHYGDRVPQIRGVRSNLVQVFVNLLTNACHALPRGGGRVRLSTRARDEGLEIEVIDSGAGIEDRVLPRIFEPFFTTKPEGHGTGLGLTIVQGIVEKHGGTVRVTSAVGQGTTFTVWLPQNFEH